MARPPPSHTPGSGCVRQAGIKNIEVVITQGSLSDAQWLSYGANKTHGLRRTNEEKQAAVQNAIKHQRGVPLGDRAIAEHVGVDHQTVANWRKKLSSPGEIRQVTVKQGRDGKVYDTSKISAANTARSKSPAGKKTKVGQIVLHLLTDNHPLTVNQVFDWLIMQGMLNRRQCEGCPIARTLR